MSTPRVAAIVQARMGSTRLPGKVLAPLAGRPLLEQLVRRVRGARSLSALVVATSTLRRDDAVAALAAGLGVACHRGPEDDVLDRYHGAARAAGADVVVRLTADNPVVDADFVDGCVDAFLAARPPLDYLDTTTSGTFPYGLSVEVLSFAALDAAWREARDAGEREHVTAFVRARPGRFRVHHLAGPGRDGDLRVTVDTPEDLERARRLFDALGLGERRVPVAEVAAWLRAHPDPAPAGAA